MFSELKDQHTKKGSVLARMWRQSLDSLAVLAIPIGNQSSFPKQEPAEPEGVWPGLVSDPSDMDQIPEPGTDRWARNRAFARRRPGSPSSWRCGEPWRPIADRSAEPNGLESLGFRCSWVGGNRTIDSLGFKRRGDERWIYLCFGSRCRGSKRLILSQQSKRLCSEAERAPLARTPTNP